ncbi:MAG: DNA primase [Gammaproteobacteria bacterium]|nr:DNA primase [Gammaproteobacteria bacterium]
MKGRIPDSFIKDLLDRTDIVELIGARVELKRAGKEYRGLSPFTNEKTPSFFVSPAKQMFFDFSSGKNGSAITFLMEYDRLPFVEAVEELAKRAGLEVPREGGGFERLVLDGPLDALAAAERFYRGELRRHQPAIDYLKSRGLSGETAKRFGIGYAPAGWDSLARQFQEPAHAVTAGLLVQKDNGGVYDFFRNRIMFPVRDIRGRIITFGGRVLPGDDDPRKYLNGRETPLFDKSRNLYGLYEARQSSKSALPYLIVVEGYMDAVMLAQHGIPEAVATLGTATSREHLNLLFKSTGKVVFCFDGDRAGRSAAWRALEQALPEAQDGREFRFMFLPEGHDPDTLVQEIGADEFRRRADRAPTLSAFLLNELSRQVNLSTVDGRARLSALARPHLARMRQGALRSLILDELVKLTRLSRADLEAAVADKKTASAETAAAPAATPEAGAARPVKRALQLLLERPDLAGAVESPDMLAQSDAPGVSLLIEVLDRFREHPEATAAQLLERWRDTPRGAALQRLLAAPIDLDEAAIAREFQEAVAHLTNKALRARAQALVTAARDRDLSAGELRELDSISRQLADRPPPAA